MRDGAGSSVDLPPWRRSPHCRCASQTAVIPVCSGGVISGLRSSKKKAVTPVATGPGFNGWKEEKEAYCSIWPTYWYGKELMTAVSARSSRQVTDNKSGFAIRDGLGPNRCVLQSAMERTKGIVHVQGYYERGDEAGSMRSHDRGNSAVIQAERRFQTGRSDELAIDREISHGSTFDTHLVPGARTLRVINR